MRTLKIESMSLFLELVSEKVKKAMERYGSPSILEEDKVNPYAPSELTLDFIEVPELSRRLGRLIGLIEKVVDDDELKEAALHTILATLLDCSDPSESFYTDHQNEEIVFTTRYGEYVIDDRDFWIFGFSHHPLVSGVSYITLKEKFRDINFLMKALWDDRSKISAIKISRRSTKLIFGKNKARFEFLLKEIEAELKEYGNDEEETKQELHYLLNQFARNCLVHGF